LTGGDDGVKEVTDKYDSEFVNEDVLKDEKADDKFCSQIKS